MENSTFRSNPQLLDTDDLREPILSSPPEVYIEPEVPDPFLIDSDASDEEAVQEIPISTPTRTLLSPNVNKDVPPPPSESDEEDAPEIYLPLLVLPTNFLPIPNASCFLAVWF